MELIVFQSFIAFIQLFAIMNPLASLPTFLALTGGLGKEERSRLINKTFWVVLALVILFAFLGKGILAFFNISIEALRVGGGIILLVVAIDMLGGVPRTREIVAEDIAIVPIATPLIVGPGTITNAIILSAEVGPIPTVLGGVAASLATYFILLSGETIIKYLGRNFIRALGRFMSIIIAAVAAELIAAGVKGWLIDWGLIENISG